MNFFSFLLIISSFFSFGVFTANFENFTTKAIIFDCDGTLIDNGNAYFFRMATRT